MKWSWVYGVRLVTVALEKVWRKRNLAGLMAVARKSFNQSCSRSIYFFFKSSSCELKSKWETRIQEDSSIPSVVNVAYSHRKSPVLGPGQMVSSECRSRFSQGVSTCVNEFLHLGIRTFPVWMWLWYWRYWHIINFYTYFCHLDPFGPSNYPLFTLEVASINFLCRWTCPTSNSRLTPAPSLRRVLGHWTGSVHPGNVVLGGNRFVPQRWWHVMTAQSIIDIYGISVAHGAPRPTTRLSQSRDVVPSPELMVAKNVGKSNGYRTWLVKSYIAHRIHGAAIWCSMDPINIPQSC